MAATPEVAEILAQVEAELMAMLQAGETGMITVHCGRGDMAVEVTAKRKRDPVRIEATKRLTVVSKTR
jgi:hypothetical protein